jgi:CheY-like chemotaxis protein
MLCSGCLRPYSSRGAGFAVYEADSADEAIRTLERQHGIRLIFTDINMPGSMDGLELAHFVRGRWPPMKIIVASGQVGGPSARA